MSRVLILNKSATSLSQARAQRTTASLGNVLALKKKAFETGSAQLNLVSLVFVVAMGVLMCGAFYLYQVNDIATKGYEIRKLESQIQDLSKESKKMEI